MKNFALLLLLMTSISALSQVPSFNAIINDTSAIGGYFFIQSEGCLMILDRYGATIYYKQTYNTDNYFKIQSNGKISYFNDGKFLLMDSTFKVVDSIACKNYKTDFHDLIILPNGHFLVFGLEEVKMNLSNYHWKSVQGVDTSIISGLIQELDARHNVVFEWHAKDHYSFDDVDIFRYQGWVHWNSFDVDKDGNILVSARNFNEITKINRKNGSIIWRLGGKHNQFTFINSPIPFYEQRNVNLLANGDITFLDGGFGIPPHSARAIEFKLDEKNKTATLNWSYTYDSSTITRAWGNIQRLSHSNTLIDFGSLPGIPGLCFAIIDSSGNKLFELNGPHAFRVYHYDELPFHLQRPVITCYDSLGVKYLDAGAGYASYKWNTGDSTRVITVTKESNYSVFVPYGEGGFMSSEKFIVNNLLPCGEQRK